VKVLVTGGAGFIGSHYVRSLLTGAYGPQPDLTITVLDALTYAGNLANLGPVSGDERLHVVEGDIADEDLVGRLLPGHAVVVNFAAESHVDRSIAGPAAFVRTNVLGTQVLLEAARTNGVRTFLQVSTDEVYGSIEHGCWPEDAPLAPSSPYSASKAAADLVALAYARTYDLPVVVTRGANTYGPYQYPEKLVPLFVTNLLDRIPVPLYGDGLHRRDWLHVDDHCRGIQLALTSGRPGRVYHVGGGTELTNRDLTLRLVDAVGVSRDLVQPAPDRRAHDRRYCLDTSRTEAELGYRPRVAFDDGLAAVVAWYRENRAWWEPLKRAHAAARES
jgi:dTDP-glucose 4,6-dehydratase